MLRASLPLSLLVAATLCNPLLAEAKKAKTSAFEKPVKVVINAIRYKKDNLALKMIALDDMIKALNKGHWDKLKPAQRKEFKASLTTLLKKLTFKKARDLFQHIDAILYSKPEVKGDRATIKSTIVVHRAYKKRELKIKWVLIKHGKRWQIFDTVMVGESTVAGIRDGEIKPLVKKGGVKLLLSTLRAKVAEVSK